MLEAIFVLLFGAIIAWILGRRSHLRLRVRAELLVLVIAILVAAAYAVAKRFAGGLGAVTNLSDRFPWGIWITFDLCGIALAAGGFVLAGTVHVFHLRRFEPILRPTVLTAFIAYQLVAAVLVLDLGRPQRFWHPLVMWQHHSVMFEITLCLSLYTLVLALEFAPVLCDRFGWCGVSAAIHKLALPIVMAGVILSTLHQSSFGSLFLIVPQKLHPLWYTPMLPILFLLSAVCAGIAVVIVESIGCERFVGRHLAPELLVGLSRAGSRLLWLYLACKLGDLLWRGAWKELTAPPWIGLLLLLEVVGGGVIPALWMGRASLQTPKRALVWASGFVMAGVVLNRTNVSWFGLLPATGLVYLPSAMEVIVTAALAIAGALAFVALSKFLPVFSVPPR